MPATVHESSSDNSPAPVWLARAGAQGEDETIALELGLSVIGFEEIPDLTDKPDRSSLLELVQTAYPQLNINGHRNLAAQLSAFAVQMETGDIVALPLKTRPGQIALGRVSGPYEYQTVEGVMRHTRPVKWIRPDVPRSHFGQDLLYSMGAFLTVCRIKRNDAETRVAKVISGGRDASSITPEAASATTEPDNEFEADHLAKLDIASTARDQIFDRIRSRFTEHEFTRLVEAVLKAEGYFTLRSPAGPDGGVDILAGRGSLGFDGPKLCVQVKATQRAVDVTVLRSLVGTMRSFEADQGLLVSWGGFTRDLEREARQSFFRVRLWRAGDLVDAICRNYGQLSEQIQNEIPLERVWTVVRDDGDL